MVVKENSPTPLGRNKRERPVHSGIRRMAETSCIDEHLLKGQELRRVRQPKTLYASDLAHPCPRQIYHKVTEDRPHDIETLRVFQAGVPLENYWTDILAKRQDTRIIATQVPAHHTITVEDTIWEIHGYVDILAQHNKGHLVVHEIKSTKSAYYLRLEEAPKPEHMPQLQFYLNALGVDHGRIDYLDKRALLEGTTSIDHSFPVQRSTEAMQDILHLAGQIASNLQKQIIPEGTPEAWNGKVCNYCNYKDLCQEADQ